MNIDVVINKNDSVILLLDQFSKLTTVKYLFFCRFGLI